MKRLQPVSEPLQQFVCASHNQTLPGSFMQHVYNSLCCNLLNNVKRHENNKLHNNDAVKYKRKNKMINIKINYAFTVSSCTKCDNNIKEKASHEITTLVLRRV